MARLSYDEMRTAIGLKLKNIREDRKLTIAQVVREAGVSRYILKGIEEGTIDWLLTSFGRLCIYYNVSPQSMFDGLEDSTIWLGADASD
jgi:transcriptional regulator with XRE-family HTH domain